MLAFKVSITNSCFVKVLFWKLYNRNHSDSVCIKCNGRLRPCREVLPAIRIVPSAHIQIPYKMLLRIITRGYGPGLAVISKCYLFMTLMENTVQLHIQIYLTHSTRVTRFPKMDIFITVLQNNQSRQHAIYPTYGCRSLCHPYLHFCYSLIVNKCFHIFQLHAPVSA